MRLSTRGRYGVKALIDLACHADAEPVPLREIASRQGLSERYLEQLFAPLRKAGLVRSARGQQGGYMLARPASDISIGDIIRTLEGPIAPTDCAIDDPGRLDHCGESGECLVREVWSEVRRSIVAVVDGITLEDMRCRMLGNTVANSTLEDR